MTEAAEWESFYVMAGGAAAVLTGLIFVAVTLHTRSIVDTAVHRDRAWSSEAILLSQLLLSMAVLAPAQPLPLLGLEILLIAAYWVVRTLRVAMQFITEIGRSQRPDARRVEWLGWIALIVALLTAGASLASDTEVGVGFGMLAFAMVVMFGFAIWNAWVLITEISD